MSNVNKVIQLISGSVSKYCNIVDCNLSDKYIAAQITYFNENELCVLPHIQKIVKSVEPKIYEGLKVYCVDANMDSCYKNVIYKTRLLYIDDSGHEDLDIRRTKQFAEFLHNEFECAYCYDTMDTIDSIQKVMEEAHRLASLCSGECFVIAEGIAKRIDVSVITFKAAGNCLIHPLCIDGVTMTHHTVCMRESNIIDPIYHDTVMSIYDWLDYMFKYNDSLRFDTTMSYFSGKAFNNEKDMIPIIGKLYERTGLTKTDWVEIRALASGKG